MVPHDPPVTEPGGDTPPSPRTGPIRARHPHAALLFADFLLSREGQIVLKDRDRVPASRAVDSSLNDFPFEMIDPTIALDEYQKWSKLWSDLFLRGRPVVREPEN